MPAGYAKIRHRALPSVENLWPTPTGKRVADKGAKPLKLSFPPVGKSGPATPLADDFAVMLVGIAARQAASPTAILSYRQDGEPLIEPALLAPGHGAFYHAIADDLRRWKEGQTRRDDK